MATNDPRPGDAVRHDPQPRVPTVGDDPRDSKDTPDPPGKVWFRDLDEAVIEADRCIQCGSCVAACPSDSLGVDDLDDQPTLVKMCTGCSRCWDNCPRSGLRYERVTAAASAAREDGAGGTYAARAADDGLQAEGQDGGAVTALLGGLLREGAIDGAVIARESPDVSLKGEAHLATSPAELRAGAGSFYNQTMQLGAARDLIEAGVRSGGLPADPDVALVGTPCVIQGAYALSAFGREGELGELALTVALFCTRSFEHDRLTSLLVEYGVDPDAVDRIDVSEGTLYAYGEGGGSDETANGDGDGSEAAEGGALAAGESADSDPVDPGAATDPVDVLLAVDVSAFDAAGLDGCTECADFTGKAADISAGNVASPDDATTLVVRSERGEEAIATAEAALDLSPVEDDDPIRRIAAWNRQNAERALPRPLDREGALTLRLEEHRETYDGTDREPAPHNPARVYQYERWC